MSVEQSGICLFSEVTVTPPTSVSIPYRDDVLYLQGPPR